VSTKRGEICVLFNKENKSKIDKSDEVCNGGGLVVKTGLLRHKQTRHVTGKIDSSTRQPGSAHINITWTQKTKNKIRGEVERKSTIFCCGENVVKDKNQSAPDTKVQMSSTHINRSSIIKIKDGAGRERYRIRGTEFEVPASLSGSA